MICGVIFGILLIVGGIVEIRTERGPRLFSKSRREVTGAEARAQGLFAVVIEVIIIAIFILTHDNRQFEGIEVKIKTTIM